MKYVYHGSIVSGLKKIRKNKSTHLQNWVYGSYSRAIATIFLSSKANDLYYYLAGSGNNNDPIILVERKKGMFKSVFNISGSIYKLKSYNFQENMTSWSAEVISNNDEQVISEERIENVYDELIKLDKKHQIKLYLYPDRPQEVPLDNSDLIPKVIKWQKNGFDVEIFFDLYPELRNKYYMEFK